MTCWCLLYASFCLHYSSLPLVFGIVDYRTVAFLEYVVDGLLLIFVLSVYKLTDLFRLNCWDQCDFSGLVFHLNKSSAIET